jgi:hypothetical protein
MTRTLNWSDGKKSSRSSVRGCAGFLFESRMRCIDLAEMGRSVLRPYTESGWLEWFGVGGEGVFEGGEVGFVDYGGAGVDP